VGRRLGGAVAGPSMRLPWAPWCRRARVLQRHVTPPSQFLHLRRLGSRGAAAGVTRAPACACRLLHALASGLDAALASTMGTALSRALRGS